jgi:hypothetical protein
VQKLKESQDAAYPILAILQNGDVTQHMKGDKMQNMQYLMQKHAVRLAV